MHKYHINGIDVNAESSHTRLLRLVGRGKRVLECGCSTGYFSKVLKEQLDCAVTGIELSEQAALEAGRYCARVVTGDMEQMDFSALLRGERFEVIMFGDVLEHLRDPGRVLAGIRPFLAEGGYVLASVPNVAHISVALELLKGRFDYRSLGILDDSHIRFFTKKSILALFRNSGFEIDLWERVLVNPEDTEFRTVLDEFPRSLLSFLGCGTEGLTYQFIIKAVPCGPVDEAVPTTIEEGASELRELRLRVEEMGKEILYLKEKERRLDDMLNSVRWRMTAPLKWLRDTLLNSRKN